MADFVPPADAIGREGGKWRPGLIVGQTDAAPYNAAWDDQGQLVGFFDWDFAAPVSRDWDLAFTAPRLGSAACSPWCKRPRVSPTSSTVASPRTAAAQAAQDTADLVEPGEST